jgi:hypothetical protein
MSDHPECPHCHKPDETEPSIFRHNNGKSREFYCKRCDEFFVMEDK